MIYSTSGTPSGTLTTFTTDCSGADPADVSRIEVIEENAANGDFILKTVAANGCDSIVRLHFEVVIQHLEHYSDIDTIYGNVKVNPIPLVITTDSNEKEYDATPLTDHEWLDTPPVGLAPGDTVVFVDVYGKLYSWYSSARVPEGDDSAVPADSLWPYGTYVQGICPAGWALPTVEDYMDMYVASGGQAGLVKSPSTEVWLPGKQGIAPNLFNAYGSGYYEGGINRYFNLLGETHFWASDYSANSSTSSNFVLNYYCDSAQFQENLKGLGYSIRCVKRIYVLPE